MGPDDIRWPKFGWWPRVRALEDICLVSESERSVDRAQEILPRRVGILYDNGLFLLLANVVNAGLVTAVLGPELGRKTYLW